MTNTANRHWTKINGIFLTCPKNEKEIFWAYELGAETIENAKIIEYQALPFEQKKEKKRVRAKIINISDKKSERNE